MVEDNIEVNKENKPLEYNNFQSNLEKPISEPNITGRDVTTAGPSPTKTLHYDEHWTRNELATQQAVNAEFNSLRTHVDDCINSTNSKLSYLEEILKQKLENSEIRQNNRIDLLNSHVQILMDERKTKKDRRWDTKLLVITIIISLLGGVALTLVAEKWILPLFK